MTVLQGIVIGLATGLVFGFALEKSRVFEPGVIVGQMQLRNPDAQDLPRRRGRGPRRARGAEWRLRREDASEAAASEGRPDWRPDPGVGIALSGACPGTTLAQIGAGYRDAWFTLAGGLTGAIFYGYLDAPITSFFAENGDKIGFDKLLGLPFWMVALGLAAALAALLVAIEKLQPWPMEFGSDVDGVGEAKGELRTVPAE